MSLKNAKSDEFYCESVAKSISEIIRFSLDEEFRKSSFKLFDASCTKETEKVIRKRLMSIIENKSTTRKDKTSRKRRKKSTEEKDKENLEEPKNTSDAEKTDQPFHTKANCESQDFQKLPVKFFEKNWLQISSQQYRHVVKRRKLNYFSQPQFSRELENTEFSKCDLYSSDSQPTSSISGSSSLFSEKTESSNQVSDNNANFCQKLFEVSFKDNAQKYLKKNSKSFSLIQSLQKTCFYFN